MRNEGCPEIGWELIESKPGPNLALFKTRFDRMKNPRSGADLNAVVLESQDWVNVVALTPKKELVAVCQYRFGIGSTTVEIPAGLMEPGETPEHAARRELREETGYTTEDWTYLGWVQANPAFLNNLCHLWLAKDVIRTHQPELDASEEVIISELTPAEMYAEIEAGRMQIDQDI